MSSGFITNMLNPNPDTGIDFVLNVETTFLVDVPVTTQAMITPSFATTLPPQQTHVPTTTNVLTPALQDLPNFGSNLYNALVEAYETDKDILDTYGDIVAYKRCRDDHDNDEEPSAGSNRGSKRKRAGKELESTSAPKEKTSTTTVKSTKGSKSHNQSVFQSAQAEEPMHTANDFE
ncbi:hypothetical protein Tco_1408567 [Tanacetum coccineum]